MEYQPELTGIRGLSALWVFVFHINETFGHITDLPLVSAGYLGVPIFFILSISLLLRSLDVNSDLKHYFIRRIKRIWPMYFVTVAFVFLTQHDSLSWLIGQTTFSAVFTNNLAIRYVFWSLQIEEVAYVFFPLIHRLSDSKKFQVGIALWFVSLAFTTWLLWGFDVARIAAWWWVSVALSSYGLGILVYLRRIPIFAAALCLPAIFFWDYHSFFALGCVVAPGLAYFVQEAKRLKLLSSKPLVKAGEFSYGLYLIHVLAIDLFGWLGVAISIPLAWLFEKGNAMFLRAVSPKK